MRPDEQKSGQGGQPSNNNSAQKEAAANIIRSQINALFGGSSDESQEPLKAQGNPTDKPAPASEQAPPKKDESDPYDRTYFTDGSLQPELEQWKQYHSAWQNYYQKYYEGYYTYQLKNTPQATTTQPDPSSAATISSNNFFGSSAQEGDHGKKVLTPEEATSQLKRRLLKKVQNSATKVRKSRHFMPIIAGSFAILLLLFLQYNQLIFANVVAYVSPGSIDPQNIILDPSSNLNVGPEPRLIIPKINVDVAVAYGIGNDHRSQMNAMNNGLAHFAIPGASSRPGELGNTPIAGHSSGDLFASGEYKFVFAQLEKLVPGDKIYANYEGKRYTYVVTKKEVVRPTQVDKLVYSIDKPVMTLITCTPLGTALNRLLVTAEQVSPDPTTATASPENEAVKEATIPGTEPTLLERLFNW